jgi:hypothetical protein
MKSYLFLTLGGIGQRFKDKGISTPKFLLIYNGNKILKNILNNYTGNITLVVGLNRAYLDYYNEIESIIKELNFKEFRILALESNSGQAETAYKMIAELENRAVLNNNLPLFIINGDTITEAKNLNLIASKLKKERSVGIIEYFISTSLNFSYIKIKKNNLITDIAEKKLVSPNATSGFYGFSSVNIFCHFYKKFQERINSQNICINHEIYISLIYNEILAAGLNITAFSSETLPIVLGTPEEYYEEISKLSPAKT